jgi:hypothetical protein
MTARSHGVSATGQSRRHLKIVLIPLGGLVVLAGSGYTIYSEMQGAERDRHAVIEEVHELARLIHRHDGQLFVRIGVPPDADSEHGDRESILRDFERLSHVEAFRITDLDVVVTGDSAVATYTAAGRLSSSDSGSRSGSRSAVGRRNEIRSAPRPLGDRRPSFRRSLKLR